MERKREQNILSLVALKLCPEDRLGQREGVSDVQMSVGIRIRKGDHERLDVGIWSCFEGLAFLPLLLDGDFIGSQGVTLGMAPTGCGRRRRNRQIFHFLHDAKGAGAGAGAGAAGLVLPTEQEWVDGLIDLMDD